MKKWSSWIWIAGAVAIGVTGCKQTPQPPSPTSPVKGKEVQKPLPKPPLAPKPKGGATTPIPKPPAQPPAPKPTPQIEWVPAQLEENFSKYQVGTNPPFGIWQGRNVVVTQYFQANSIPGNVAKFNSGILCDFQDRWGDFNITADYKTFAIGKISIDLRIDDDRYYQINYWDKAVEVERYVNPFTSRPIFSKKMPDLEVPASGWQLLGLSRKGSQVSISIDGQPVGELNLSWLGNRPVRICFEGDGIEGALLDNLKIVGEKVANKK